MNKKRVSLIFLPGPISTVISLHLFQPTYTPILSRLFSTPRLPSFLLRITPLCNPFFQNGDSNKERVKQNDQIEVNSSNTQDTQPENIPAIQEGSLICDKDTTGTKRPRESETDVRGFEK